MLDYYKLLNIPKIASTNEIKKAYRIAAHFWHPDKNKSTQAHQKFIEITEAYNILLNPSKRKVYDELFQEQINSIVKPKETTNESFKQNSKKKSYEEWVKEERIRAEKLSITSIDNALTEGFHFVDQYGWLILFIIMFIFMIVVFGGRR
jgi:DnaJ-class molecular chaperone